MNRGRRVATGGALAVGALCLLGGPATSLGLTTETTAPVDATVQGPSPHGEGTVLSASVGGKEAVVVGRSRGEQTSSGYHGHNTTLAVLGNDVIANDTTAGQSAKGPIAPLQEQVLDQVCTGSGGNICVEALRSDSATTATGSTNHQRLAGVKLGGDNGIKAVAADSNGNIQSNGDCQTAHGDVTLVSLAAGGNPLLDIGQSATDSNACPTGSTVHNSENPLVAIGGQPIPLPGCGANSPGNLLDLSPLLVLACNAGSSAGATAANAALAGTALPGSGSTPTLAALTGAGTGAGATAPAAQSVAGVRETAPTTAPSAGTNANTGNGKGGDKGNENAGPPAEAQASKPLTATAAAKLPYTGTDVLLSLFVAACLLAAGLGMRRFADARLQA